MDNRIKVAVVRSDRRRGAVAEALSLIREDLRRRIEDDSAPLLLATTDNPGRPWTCTHRDTLSACVDAVLAAGAARVAIASSSEPDARSAISPFDRLGYRGELWGRPVSLNDTAWSQGTWSTIRWIDAKGEPFALRIPAKLSAARCRINLGVASTHGVHRAGLAMTGLAAFVHPEDRSLMGLEPTLRGLPAAFSVLETWRGGLVRAWLRLRSISGGMRLTERERGLLDSARRAASCLVALSSFLMPRISLIDAFDAMEGEGPRHGRRTPLNTVIAGTDAVAVDAVAALVMGFDPKEIAYLRLAQASRLGTADLAAIEIVGDTPHALRRPLRRHALDALLSLAGNSADGPSALSGPHFGRISAPRRDQALFGESLDAHRL